jgi:hypothetical protein
VVRDPLGQLLLERRINCYPGTGELLSDGLLTGCDDALESVGVETAHYHVGRVLPLHAEDLPPLDSTNGLFGSQLHPTVPGKLYECPDDLVYPALRHPYPVHRHDGRHAGEEGRCPRGADPGVQGVYGDDFPQAFREPAEAIQVTPRCHPGPIKAEEPQERRTEAGIVPVGGQQARYLQPEPTMHADEPCPRPVPGMSFLYRQRGDLAPVVVLADLRQPLEFQACYLSRATSISLAAGRIPASQEFLPHAGEGDDRGSGVYPLTFQLDATALAAEVVVGLQQRDLVPGAAQ